MAPRSTCMSRILMVLGHFVAQNSDTSLPMLPSMTTFPKEGGRLSARQSAEPLWGRKACRRRRLCLLKHTKTIVFMCQRVWQGLQTEGGWWRAVQWIGWAGGGELVEGNPREEIREQYRRNAAQFCCRVGQSTSSTQQPAKAQRQRWESSNTDWKVFLCCFLEQTIEQAVWWSSAASQRQEPFQPVRVVYSCTEPTYYWDKTGEQHDVFCKSTQALLTA